MSLPDLFTFYARNGQTLTWFLNTDETPPVPIEDCAVTASLYASRNIDYPDVTPGTVVEGFDGLILVHTVDGAYVVEIHADDFDPALGNGYALVVDAVQSSTTRKWHWERPAEVLLP